MKIDISTAAAAMGRKGGKATSPAKEKAARENAKRGGWPKGKARRPFYVFTQSGHRSEPYPTIEAARASIFDEWEQDGKTDHITKEEPRRVSGLQSIEAWTDGFNGVLTIAKEGGAKRGGWPKGRKRKNQTVKQTKN